MKIEIANPGFAYSVLATGGNQDGENQEEDWKKKEDPFRYNVDAKYNVAEMPYPLNGVNFSYSRVGQNYAARIFISSRDKSAFSGISKKLSGRLNSLKKKFLPTTPDGTGYVLDETGKDNAISILNSDMLRVIGIGCGGAAARELNSEEKFFQEIGELESITNILLECCNLRAPRGIIIPKSQYKDLRVLISPV
jgi:hypothetical protein